MIHNDSACSWLPVEREKYSRERGNRDDGGEGKRGESVCQPTAKMRGEKQRDAERKYRDAARSQYRFLEIKRSKWSEELVRLQYFTFQPRFFSNKMLVYSNYSRFRGKK